MYSLFPFIHINVILCKSFLDSSKAAFIYSVASFSLVAVSLYASFDFVQIFHTSYAKLESFLMDPMDSEKA